MEDNKVFTPFFYFVLVVSGLAMVGFFRIVTTLTAAG